ncbi:phosphoribosylglycinamide formyltransferase [Candidatus Woesearchaeota archaeon]|nr:phosphoribosylglycinamide formyltransferase [Candidatus Woesearchaeota archaeon]
MINIGILGSTNGTDMQAVLDAISSKKINAKISVVISNREDAYILERARKHNLKSVFVDIKQFSDISDKEQKREEFDKKISEVLDENGVELILAIGYMRFFSGWFVKRYEHKIMNIHPSLLPEFAGGMDLDVHAEVLKAGKKKTGATLHFVDETVDNGPIILQKEVLIDDEETKDTLKEKVQLAEQEIIVKGIELYEQGKIKVKDNKVTIIR